jgi:6-pyruvoyltetrahydropterin/6-carboxytetrahydropterin synthase
MESVFLTRRVTFDAEHRYGDAPYHGHTYSCSVSVTGTVDPVSGMLVDLETLDEVLNREIVQRFHKKRINDDVPEFRRGKMAPTGENLARFVFERVSSALTDGARVMEVTVAEDSTLSATCRRRDSA